MVRRLIAVLLLCLPLLSAAQTKAAQVPSDEATRTALARQILDVSFKPQVMERMWGVVDQQFQEGLAKQLPGLFEATIDSLEEDERITEAQATLARSLMPGLIEKYRREELPKLGAQMRAAFQKMDWKKMIYDAGTAFYATQFTTQELKQVLAFQSSPLGQKLIDQSPALMSQMMPALQAELTKVASTVARQAVDPSVFEGYVLSTSKSSK